eukprot:COSAG02_NODE_1138_length_14297_cov_4.388537_5_plen_58_part_00
MVSSLANKNVKQSALPVNSSLCAGAMGWMIAHIGQKAWGHLLRLARFREAFCLQILA